MPSSLRSLFDRLSAKVNRSAAGTPIPAGVDPPVPGERPKPTAHERTLMRRRLRALERHREQLGDGAAELKAIDAEARALTTALAELKTLDELVAAGAVKRCPGCGELVGPGDGQCAACHTALTSDPAAKPGDGAGVAPQPLPPARVSSGQPSAPSTAA
jgi:mono/diheme cytochrome c family protein